MPYTFDQLINDGSVKYRKLLLKLCSPLMEKLNISDFYYGTVSNEGMVSEVATHLDWMFRYADKKLFLNNPFYTDPRNHSPGVYLHRSIQAQGFKSTLEEAKDAQIHPFLIVLEKNEKGTMQYGFSLNRDDPRLENIVLNEMQLLRQFVEYFRQETKHVFDKMQETPFNVAEQMGSKFFEKHNLPANQLSPADRLYALKSFNLISDELAQVKFTQRELECINLRLTDKTAAEISAILGLSRRTVEHYLESIRTKLHCDRKTSYVKLLHQLKALNLI